MQIGTYISEVLNHGRHHGGFPAYVDIPKSFVDRCYSLYTSGEARRIELGLTLSSAADGSLQVSDAEIEGANTGTGITLPESNAHTDIGDVHCHPSNSIGHKNGYAAHSPEDVVSMEGHRDKPLFLRFVCSGTRIYLMAHRNGHSNIQRTQVFQVRDGNDGVAKGYFEQYCPFNKEERDKKMVACDTQAQANEKMRDIRRMTPGLGKEMERLSIDGGKEIARRCRLGFYMADQGYGISVWFYGYLRMYLQ